MAEEHVAFSANIIKDPEGDQVRIRHSLPVSDAKELLPIVAKDPDMKEAISDDLPLLSDDDNIAAESPTADLLRWHYRLNHILFKVLRSLAKLKVLLRRLADVKSPVCVACLFGTLHKQPWRAKAMIPAIKVFRVKKPGQCVSINQMVSSKPGFIAQLKGKLTMDRYSVVTVFMDHFSRLRYCHIQRNATSSSTLEAKRAFKGFCELHGAKVCHYHCDNGQFADNAWLNDCKG